ncbi:hypothetical protein BGZ68_003572, partial [Mortierella alpina]
TRLRTTYVPSQFNPADAPLRRMNTQLEWSISQDFFQELDSQWGPHTVDLFASKANAKLNKQIVHLSAVEPHSVDTSEDAGGEDSSNSHHAVLAQCDLVPEDIEMGSASSDSDSSSDGSSSPGEQLVRASQKSDVVSLRLERRQQTLTAAGASDTVLSLLFEDNNSIRRRGAYSGPQRAFARWMEHLDLDPLVPNPVELMNFLAYGYTTNQWSFNTVKVYKTAIFALFNDTTIFTSYAPFEELMKALARKGVKRIRHAEVNLEPIFTFINGLKSNDRLHLLDLTQKMCWLLAVCGFLRPDDIACIDLNESRMTNTKLELSILLPKELRSSASARRW